MRKYTLVLIGMLLSVFFMACGGSGDKYPRSTPEELGESVLNCIVNKDKDGLRGLVPTKADMKKTVENSGMPQEEIDEFMGQFDRNWERLELEMENDIFGEFDALVAELERSVGLESIQLKEVQVEKKEDDGFEVADIKVKFTSGGGDGALNLNECANLSSGWVISPEGFKVR